MVIARGDIMLKRTITSVFQIRHPDEVAEWQGFYVGPFECNRNKVQGRFRPHRHSYYEVFLVFGGKGIFWNDFATHSWTKTGIFFTSPGQVHHWEILVPCQGYALAFDREFFSPSAYTDELLAECPFFSLDGKAPALDLHEKRAAQYRKWFDSLEAEYRGNQPGSDDILRSLVVIILTEARRDFMTVEESRLPRKANMLTSRFRQLVEELYRTRAPISVYASKLKITTTYLCDVVRAETGSTVKEIILNRLVLEAKRLLLHSDLTVSEIAYSLNFCDPSYFSRFFRRVSKMSPAEFRERTRAV
jgi:AraC-like DNA-binding protein